MCVHAEPRETEPRLPSDVKCKLFFQFSTDAHTRTHAHTHAHTHTQRIKAQRASQSGAHAPSLWLLNPPGPNTSIRRHLVSSPPTPDPKVTNTTPQQDAILLVPPLHRTLTFITVHTRHRGVVSHVKGALVW